MARADLLALTEDGLIQLANAGLVKRALREVAAGQGPALAETGEGTVEARFPDGTLTRLAPGRQPGEATCTCPASGMCRHRVALVVAYRAAAGAAEAAASDEAGSRAGREGRGHEGQGAVPEAAWDPGTLDGTAFEAGLNAAASAELKRLLAAGLTVGLERGPVPVARLPTASVRFLVPHAVGYARCDCAAGGGCAHVAVAIRAFREAAGAADVRLGGAPAAPAAGDLAEVVDGLVAGLLEFGTAAGPEAHGAALDRLRRAAGAHGATQVLLAQADLAGQLAAYAERSAAYDEAAVLALATELLARTRVGDAAALGLGQPYETAMAKTRLVSLGARLMARGRGVTARVALADTDTGATLALERGYAPAEDEAGFVAGLPGRPLVPGLPLGGTGQGQILTSVARRRADGLLALGQGARGRTALLPRDAVVRLPAPLAGTDPGVILRRLGQRAPVFLRPRDRLDAFHVFDVAEVLGQAWSPGVQLWQAAADLTGAGGRLFLARAYDRAAPGALDVLASAFAGRWGAVRQVAGPVRIEGGSLVCDPWSVGTDRLVVPDLAAPDGPASSVPPASGAGERAVVEEAVGLLAGALHAGRRAFAAAAGASGPRLVARLRETGHAATAARLAEFLAARGDGPAAFARAALWVAAMQEDAGPVEAAA